MPSNPTDKSVGYFHSSASPTFAAKPTGGVWMSWWLESPAAVDEAYQLALQHGMTVTMPPTDEPWSVREFHLRVTRFG